jgi:mono/diheme cytochrome c family protein
MSIFRKVSMRSVGLRVLIVAAVAFTALSPIGSVAAHQKDSTPSSGRQSEASPKGDGGPRAQAQPSSDRAAGLPIPPGATPEIVDRGFHLFRGEEGGGTCYTCHGADAKGTPLAPDLTANKWLWSDGSWASITKTITEGVPQPKEHQSPMPPRGDTQFTPEQVSAVAAYVWAMSHH